MSQRSSGRTTQSQRLSMWVQAVQRGACSYSSSEADLVLLCKTSSAKHHAACKITYKNPARSKLEYASPIWSFQQFYLIEPLQSVQITANRITHSLYSYDARAPFLKSKSSLSMLYCRRRTARLLSMHRKFFFSSLNQPSLTTASAHISQLTNAHVLGQPSSLPPFIPDSYRLERPPLWHLVFSFPSLLTKFFWPFCSIITCDEMSSS